MCVCTQVLHGPIRALPLVARVSYRSRWLVKFCCTTNSNNSNFIFVFASFVEQTKFGAFSLRKKWKPMLSGPIYVPIELVVGLARPS